MTDDDPRGRIAWLGCVLALAAAHAGCGGGGGGGSASSTAAAASVSSFLVTDMSPAQAPAASTAQLTLTFSRPVDLISVQSGTTLRVVEDTDQNPGGTFAPLPGTVSALDPTGAVLAFTPQRPFRDGREVRLVLTRGVLDLGGAPLERGAAGGSISFLGAIPDAVFEGRFLPSTAPAPTPVTPAPAAPPPVTPAQPPGVRPAAFQPAAGTDVWHLDFALRAADFAEDLRRHGLGGSGDATTDRLARDLVMGQALSWCSQKYLRTSDGKAVPGQSWRVSFTATAPAGSTVARTHSREAVGGRHAQSTAILGASLFDRGNQRREDNSRAGGLGIFSRQINGARSTLSPALAAADRRYLDGSYALGAGTAAEDDRLQAILRAAGDWGHALGAVLAHEVGHSVGLNHDDTDAIGIMRTATGAQLLSNRSSRMSATSAAVLTRNLGRSQ